MGCAACFTFCEDSYSDAAETVREPKPKPIFQHIEDPEDWYYHELEMSVKDSIAFELAKALIVAKETFWMMQLPLRFEETSHQVEDQELENSLDVILSEIKAKYERYLQLCFDILSWRKQNSKSELFPNEDLTNRVKEFPALYRMQDTIALGIAVPNSLFTVPVLSFCGECHSVDISHPGVGVKQSDFDPASTVVRMTYLQAMGSTGSQNNNAPGPADSEPQSVQVIAQEELNPELVEVNLPQIADADQQV